jgi:hypothetical protein
MAPGQALALTAHNLAADRVAQAETFVPMVEIELFQVALVGDCYEVEHRCHLVERQTHAKTRPGKVWRGEKVPGALLDSFLLGTPGGAYEKAPDREVLLAAAEVAFQHRLFGDDLRRFDNAIAKLLALRAGALIDPSTLPRARPLIREGDAADVA